MNNPDRDRRRGGVEFGAQYSPGESDRVRLGVIDQDRLLGNEEHALFEEVQLALVRLDVGLDRVLSLSTGLCQLRRAQE